MSTYLDVSDDIERHIASSPLGEQLPSEDVLAQQYGVARLTIRAAVQELERRHLVKKIHGRGTFVTRRIPYRVEPENITTFASNVAETGLVARTTNDSVAMRPSVTHEAKQLQISTGTRVVQIERRRWLDGEVVGAETSILPAKLVPGLADRIGPEGSLHRLIVDHYDLCPRRVWYRAEIVPAETEVANRLRVKGHPDVIHIQGRFKSVRLDRPTELEEGWMRADIFSLVLEMGEFE